MRAAAQESAKANGRSRKDAEEDDSKVAVFSKETLEKSVESVKKALAAEASAKEKYDLAKGSTKTAYNTAAKLGVPQDELKFIVEKNDFTEDFRANVNVMREMLGQPALFEFSTSKQ